MHVFYGYSFLLSLNVALNKIMPITQQPRSSRLKEVSTQRTNKITKNAKRVVIRSQPEGVPFTLDPKNRKIIYKANRFSSDENHEEPLNGQFARSGGIGIELLTGGSADYMNEERLDFSVINRTVTS